MEQIKQSGWRTLFSKNFLIVLIMACCNQFAQMCVRTPINQFGRELGIAASLLGLIATLQGAWKLLFRPFWGVIIDKISKKAGLTIALSVNLCTYLVYAYTNSVPMFVIGRFMQGVGFAVASTSVTTAVGQAVDRRALGTAMGFYNTLPKFMQVIAPTISMALYKNYGARYSFLTAAGCILCGIIIAQFLTFDNVAPKPVKTDEPKEKTRKKLGDIISIKGLLFFPMMLAADFQTGVLDLIIVVYATALGIPEAGALFFSVQQLVTVCLAVPFGLIQDKFGGKAAVLFSYLCRAAGAILIAVNPTYICFIIAGALCGTHKPAGVVLQTEAIKLQPRKRMGIAISTHLLMADFAVMIGSSVGGLLVDHAGYSVCFGVCGALMIGGAVLYLIMQPIIQKAVQEANIADNQS